MSDSGEEKKGLSFGAIAFWVVLACVIGYFVVPGILNPPKDPLLEGLTDPEKALRTYQNTAYGFTKQTPGCGFMEVEKIVPVSDWAWYEANYQDIKKYDIVGSMRDGVLDAIDPTQGAAIDRRVGLSVAILAGCYSPGSEIISRDIRETEAFFVCRTRDIETETQTDWKVRVIKDGKFWKVSGFALGIANLTGSAQPGDIITAQLDRTAAKRKQVAEDMGMPETASPASKSPAFPSASTDNAGDSGGSALDLLGSADGGSGDSALDLLAGGEEDAELVSDGGSDPFGGNASTAEDSTKMVSSPKPAATESTKAEADVASAEPRVDAESGDAADPFASLSGEGSADESGNSDPFGLSDDGADEPSSGGAGSVDGGVAAGAKGANPMTMFRNEDGTFDQKAAREAFLGNKPLPGSGPPASGGAAATATPGKPAGKPAPQAASKPNPGALIGGTTAPKVQVDPALLAPADALINQAAKDWNGQKYKQAVVNAEKALKIYQTHLGESHPKIASVKKMIEDAKAKADGK